jgi:hypothetical protein
MGNTTIQRVVWAALVQSGLWSAAAQGQPEHAAFFSLPAAPVDSLDTLPQPFRDLLARPDQLADPLNPEEEIEPDPAAINVVLLGPELPQLPRETIADPLRGRKGGRWSLDEQWTFGLGMLRAGDIRLDEPDQPDVVSETLWMSVDGAQGQVHMLDAGLNWNIDPVDAVRVSFEGGVRTLAQSDQAAANGADISPADLDGNFVTQPVMGAAVRWSLTNWAYIEGSATGNLMDVAGTYLDLTAQAGVNFTPRTGLVAGYRFLDASFNTSGDRSTLSQDAVFAGLQIRY